MFSSRYFAVLSAALSLNLYAGSSHAAPENGWWWNPAQSGRGFSIEVQGDTMFLGFRKSLHEQHRMRT